MNSYQQAYNEWLLRAKEPDIAEELSSIKGNDKAIEDRFYQHLAFGTGGLRGVIGAGTNRMNVYTVGRATQGLAASVLASGGDVSVAIAYDSRDRSDVFARMAASVLAANGVTAYLYRQLMPTPALSFAVRRLGCAMGIVITASHNPAVYNGYKAYGPDGCQVTDQAAADILARIEAVDYFDGVERMDFDTAVSEGKIRYIGEDVERAYLEAVSAQSVLPEGVPRGLKIVYTPLHGAGIQCVPECLRMNGFTGVCIPEAQAQPDGSFPTCPYPNPEEPAAMAVGIAMAREQGADLVLATDPDCDRVGIAVRDGDDYVLMSGNQVGVLLMDFLCRMRTEAGTMPERPVAVTTVVSTPMSRKVAAAYGLELREVLTGFKYIGEQIGLLEKAGEEDRFVFGFEESYGYLAGAYVRDKDAVFGSLLICEMAAYYAGQGMTLAQAMETLYGEYGAYSERLSSYEFEGASGAKKREDVMRALRENPPREIAGKAVLDVDDFAKGVPGFMDLPRSDVIRLRLDGGASAVVRPSGTEPKMKVYCFAHGGTRAESEAAIGRLLAWLDEWVKRI